MHNSGADDTNVALPPTAIQQMVEATCTACDGILRREDRGPQSSTPRFSSPKSGCGAVHVLHPCIVIFTEMKPRLFGPPSGPKTLNPASTWGKYHLKYQCRALHPPRACRKAFSHARVSHQYLWEALWPCGPFSPPGFLVVSGCSVPHEAFRDCGGPRIPSRVFLGRLTAEVCNRRAKLDILLLDCENLSGFIRAWGAGAVRRGAEKTESRKPKTALRAWSLLGRREKKLIHYATSRSPIISKTRNPTQP